MPPVAALPLAFVHIEGLFVGSVVADAIRLARPRLAALLDLDGIEALPTKYVGRNADGRPGEHAPLLPIVFHTGPDRCIAADGMEAYEGRPRTRPANWPRTSGRRIFCSASDGARRSTCPRAAGWARWRG